jgi:hypothetical protein
MYGHEHYTEAERLLNQSTEVAHRSAEGAQSLATQALAHAALAQAAAAQSLAIAQAEAHPDIARHGDSGQFTAYR